MEEFYVAKTASQRERLREQSLKKGELISFLLGAAVVVALVGITVVLMSKVLAPLIKFYGG